MNTYCFVRFGQALRILPLVIVRVREVIMVEVFGDLQTVVGSNKFGLAERLHANSLSEVAR